MRLLPVWPDHAGRGTAGPQQGADPRADRRTHGWQHLPLRHLPAHHQCDPARRAGGLTVNSQINRRLFLGNTAGLTFVLTLTADPLGVMGEALADAPFAPNIWLTIAPDGVITIV